MSTNTSLTGNTTLLSTLASNSTIISSTGASKISINNPFEMHKYTQPLHIYPLPSEVEDIVFPLMGMCDKLVLGGSLGLYVMDIMEYDFNKRKPDIDFSLTEPLTVEEFTQIKDFFQLEIVANNNDYDFDESDDGETTGLINRRHKPVEHFLTKELIQLRKYDEKGNTVYTIDFFNSQYIKPKDVVHFDIPFKETPLGTTPNKFPLKVNHPALTISFKARYAYDTRVGKQFKHWEDIEKIDKKKYFKIAKQIKTKQVRTGSDNTKYNITTYYDPYNNIQSGHFNLPF
jgi:hypothetical protein